MSGSDGGYESLLDPSSRSEPQEPSGNRDVAIQGPGFDGDRCTICLEGLGVSGRAILPCDHPYHAQCIADWLHMYELDDYSENRSRCPMCRKELIYTCGYNLSKHLIRPGVTILLEELDLRCPICCLDSDGLGDYADRPCHGTILEEKYEALGAWEYAMYSEYSSDPYDSESSDYLEASEGLEGLEDSEDFEHSQLDEDAERMLEIIDYLKSTDLVSDTSQSQGESQGETQGEPQENYAPEEQNAGEGLELEHPIGPANTNEDIGEGEEEEGEYEVLGR
ncbi:hypothetical protein F5Y04DRAFT_289725 [Hypomontagnella monticulosa]|nr:hypothetical protein F5Y04DRAFT_289725 [Hypomontagnella monticulosa]